MPVPANVPIPAQYQFLRMCLHLLLINFVFLFNVLSLYPISTKMFRRLFYISISVIFVNFNSLYILQEMPVGSCLGGKIDIPPPIKLNVTVRLNINLRLVDFSQLQDKIP